MIKNQCTYLALLLCSSIFCNQIISQTATHSYISDYADIAVREMHLSGIPASITLAQGLLESDHGRSALSQKGNNHFGMKCGSDWNGPTMNVKDDDYDKNGHLMKSCFRVFASAEDSYRAHSAFLLNPKKEYRYGHLFTISSNDYHAWAMGLQDAGYATDTRYGSKLIKLIETYRLYQYDQISKNQNASDPTLSIFVTDDSYHTTLNEVVITDHGQVLDLQDHNTQYVHIVEQGDDMVSIARKYKINLEKLYHYNRLPPKSQPLEGEEINLNAYHHWGKRPKFFSHVDILKQSKDEILFESEEFDVEKRH